MTKIVMKEATALPFGLKDSDLKYPKRPKKWNWHKPHPTDLLHTITLYQTQRFGWVVTTLHIRAPGRRSRVPNAQPRTYGIDAGGHVVTVGLGPHVLQTVTAYVTRGRADALKELVELHSRGLADAGSIRDRISTRRAQTTLLRRWF